MRPSPPLPPKKEVALALLAHSSVSIHLDPRVANVVVPPWFKKQPQLVLQVGLNMPVPIHDLHLDDDGLSCTLSFNRSPFHCLVPWTSVYAMVDDEGRAMVWPEDVPPEVQQQVRVRAVENPPETGGARPTLAAAPAKMLAAAPAKKDATKRPKLEEVRREAGGGSPASGAGGAGGKKRGGRSERGAAAKGGATPTHETRLSAVPSPARSRPALEKGADKTLEKSADKAPDKQGEKSSPLRVTRVPEGEREAPATPAVTPVTRAEPSRPNAGAPNQGAPKPAAGAARKTKRELPPYLRVVK